MGDVGPAHDHRGRALVGGIGNRALDVVGDERVDDPVDPHLDHEGVPGLGLLLITAGRLRSIAQEAEQRHASQVHQVTGAIIAPGRAERVPSGG